MIFQTPAELLREIYTTNQLHSTVNIVIVMDVRKETMTADGVLGFQKEHVKA